MNVPKLRFKEFDGEWEEYKLGSLGSVAMNKRIYKEETSSHGDIPFFKIGTFGGKADAFISRAKYEEYKEKYPYPQKGDLLISASGSIGRVIEYNGEEAYYQDSNIIWLKHDDRLDNLFLKQFYNIVRWSGIEGTTIKRLYNKNILETKINLPSIEEQRKIGEFFKELDNKIILQQQKIDLLQEQKKGYMQKIFSREIRFDGFKEPWEEKKLEDISKKITKGTTPKDKSWEGTVKYVKTDSIDQISGEILNKYFTSIEEHEGYLNRSQLKKGDILFSIVGTLGRVGIVKEKNLPANTNQQIAIIRLKEKVDKNFIFNVLKSSRIIAFIKSDSTVGAQPSLSLWQINELQVPYPNQEEQKKIGTFFKKIDDNIILQQQKSELLQKQKQGFMQQMFI